MPVASVPSTPAVKLGSLVSSKLLGPDIGSGKTCLSFDFDTAPPYVTSNSAVTVLRAPVFLKGTGGAVEGLLKGRPAGSVVPVAVKGTQNAPTLPLNSCVKQIWFFHPSLTLRFVHV